MTGSRTIRVIFILILAMTFGAIALEMMETRPAPLSPMDLIAATSTPFGSALETDVPIKAGMWRHIVLHSTGGEGTDVASRAHFVVDADGAQLVHPTGIWKIQRQAKHVNSSAHDYNADSIAIVLKGDFSQRPPSARQLKELVKLVRSLQQACNIDTDKVFMYRPDLSSGRGSPGKAFPARQFADMLDRP